MFVPKKMHFFYDIRVYTKNIKNCSMKIVIVRYLYKNNENILSFKI
jgi:hypothetical protein